MTKTSLDITTRALRRIKVCPKHREPKAEDHADARDILEVLLEELSTKYGMAQTWTVETVPDIVFISLSRWLAGVIARDYGKTGYERDESVGRSATIASVQADMDFEQLPERMDYF